MISNGDYSLLQVQKGVYYAIARDRDRLPEAGEFGRSLKDLIKRCVGLKADKLHLRVDKRAQGLPGILRELGFKSCHERVEFQLSVSQWPDEAGSPFTWTPASLDGVLSVEKAAELLGRSGQGDPDWSPEDDPFQLIKSYLAEEGLYGSLDAVQAGFIDGEPAGVVIAQANAKTGWCRITYMGLLPEFRGRGLGRWLHRHGFAMMRIQGGKEYHGGTVSTNASMIRLFLAHGCSERRRMEEWVREF